MKNIILPFLLLTGLAFAQQIPTDSKHITDREAGEITVDRVLNQYFVAVAGSRTKMEAVSSIVMEFEMTLSQSTESSAVTYKFKNPNKTMIIISFKGETMKQGFDGKNGFSSIGSLTEKQIEEFRGQKGYFPELNYTEEKAVLEGIFSLEEKETYKVIVTYGDNKKSIYFDAQTGLKLREEAQSENRQSTITDYSEYKDFDGYKFPTKIITSISTPDTSEARTMSQTVTKYVVNPPLTNKDFKL
ncbi:MAG: hypothetical protein LBQ84_09800 [Flavobacteriaceae bacterium]|jgi:hypothetical protein|nr:hypothetical protein [Flavobacteriaceae bacterium]